MFKTEVTPKDPESEWVLFLHGFGGSGETWNRQIDAFRSRYNTILVSFHDQPEDGEMDPRSFCEQLSAQLHDITPTRVHLVAMSSGSLIALAFSSQYPQQVQSMVLGGGMLSFHLLTRFLLGTALILQNLVPYMVLYRFFAWVIMPGKNHRRSRSIFTREAEKLGHREFCRWLRFISVLRQTDPFLQALNQVEPTIPALYIMGEQDHLFKGPVLREVMKLRGASARVIANCGHVCSIEQPDEFNRLALDFLSNTKL